MLPRQLIALDADRSLQVHQEGAGQDVVLVHGALTTGHDWLQSRAHKALTEICRVTVLDRPGHGLSQRPRFAASPREQADQIAEGLGYLGIRRAVFVGHSFGALVAMALAEQHPSLVTELVLVAPLAFPEPRPLEHITLLPRAMPVFGPFMARLVEFTQIDRPVTELLQQVMFSPSRVPEAWRASYPFELILAADAMVAEGEDAASVLPWSPTAAVDIRSIGTPTQIITGTSDCVVDNERQGKALARQLHSASLIEVYGAGHMVHQTHSDEVVAAVRRALDRAAK